MSFHVGQKVVCVDDAGQDGPGDVVRRGHNYTVRGVDLENKPHPGLWLEEIMLPDVHGDWQYPERSFKSWRFRPVIERKTDISIFTEMLTPDRMPARVS